MQNLDWNNLKAFSLPSPPLSPLDQTTGFNIGMDSFLFPHFILELSGACSPWGVYLLQVEPYLPASLSRAIAALQSCSWHRPLGYTPFIVFLFTGTNAPGCPVHSQVTMLLTPVRAGVPSYPVQQHSSSCDALAMCQPDAWPLLLPKMFPEWNKKQQSTTASSNIRAEPLMSTRLEYTARWASPVAGTGDCQLKPKQQWQLCIWSGTFQSNLLLSQNLWAPYCVPKKDCL